MAIIITAIDPAPGLPLDRRAVWVVEVTDTGADPEPHTKAAILVQYAGLGRDEVAYNGAEIRPGFVKRSRLEVMSANTIRLHIAPDRGWPDAPTFYPIVIDRTSTSPAPETWRAIFPDQVHVRRRLAMTEHLAYVRLP